MRKDENYEEENLFSGRSCAKDTSRLLAADDPRGAFTYGICGKDGWDCVNPFA